MNASASPRKRRKKPARKVGLFSWRYLLPAGFFVVLAVFLLLGLGRNPNEIPSPLIGKEAPAFELPRLGGRGSSGESHRSRQSIRKCTGRITGGGNTGSRDADGPNTRCW